MKRTWPLIALLLMALPANAAPSEPIRLPGGLPVPVILVEPLSSKTANVGDRFTVRVAEDIKMGTAVVIPAGTQGTGEVTRVVRKGAFGRSGKIEARVLYVNAPDQLIVLNGRRLEKGRSGTLPTIAVASVAGLFSGFVTGGSANLEAGTRLAGYVDVAPPAAGASAPM